ncbi:hypothetical protein D9Q98_007544 [Chlorella vulgaris]|uniref:Transmembrane protein 45B n=1 Tax=Chlorella vulgaris TaxID=3077 RepID=A0A9D4TM96_CHLVU|nr:hypothetical protein D9Q98_007544 [Chlorella vulgaris]
MDASAAMNHTGHDHSAHAAHGHESAGMDVQMAGMDMGGAAGGDMKFMAAVGRRADGSYYYFHGGFDGHILPGCFFLFWGLWWAVATFTHYTRSLAAKKQFRTRGWQLLPFGPRRLRQMPLEPFVKLVLPLAGILAELWLGHESYRQLYHSDGKFETENLNDWQHSTMYASFMASGLVDLLGFYFGAPHSAELSFLGLAFLSEGLLLVFHLKGPRVEIMVHLILVLQILATVVAIVGEMAAPRSILAATARPWLTMLQGVWWIQTAYIMYKSQPQWDPDYMGSGMMVPVPFVLWMLGTAFFTFCLFLIIKAITERQTGRKLSCSNDGGSSAEHHLHAPLPLDEEADGLPGPGGPYTPEVELSGLPLKTYAAHNGHGV